jgi:DNA-binding MarR family transcriptional regulator
MVASARAHKAVSKTDSSKKTSKPVLKASKSESATDLDKLIHERTRLALVSALAASPALTFNDLKSLLQITDGNLSVHARKLEDAGYIECSKGFEGRVPRTEYRLTNSGRTALHKYITHMEALIGAMKKL